MSEWVKFKLGDLIKSVSKTFKFSDTRVIFLNTSDTLEGKVINHFIFNPKDLPGQAKKSIQFGDILYSEIRPANRRYAFVDFNADNYVVSTKLMVLRVVDEKLINPRFLYYFLVSEEIINYLQMLAESRSGTFPQIRFEEISLLDINLPPLPVQNIIVNILRTFDDKIELNNAINKNLEDLAQALFKRWFVDFEFPNEEGLPYQSSGGEMVESELGMIPKGWRVGVFGEIAKVIGGYAFKSSDFLEDGDNGIIKIKNINGRIVDIKNTQHVKEIVVRHLPRKFKIHEGELLVAMTGAEVGKIGIVPKTNRNLWLNQRVGKIEPTLQGSNAYIHTFFNYAGLTQEIRNAAMGSAQPNISSTGIESLKCLIPKKEIIAAYSEQFDKAYRFFVENPYENEQLELLRDNLLPKLISGELEVNQALSETEKAL